jgi:hypothetical protein
MTIKLHAISVILAAGALVTTGGVAQAVAPTAPVTPDATASVVISPEVQTYLDTLGPQERAEFIATKLPAAVVETRGAQVPADTVADASVKAATATGRTVSPMSSGCWTIRWDGWAKAAAGNTLYTYYHVGYWCSSGSSITAASTAAAGGETSTPGWRYEGVINESHGIVSNQGRSYTQQKFVLGVGGWDVQSPTPCLRVNGLTNGTATGSSTCGIY